MANVLDFIGEGITDTLESVTGIDTGNNDNFGNWNVRGAASNAAKKLLGNDKKAVDKAAARKAKASYKSRKMASQAKYRGDAQKANQQGFLRDGRGVLEFMTRNFGKLEAKMKTFGDAAEAAGLPGKEALAILAQAEKYSALVPSPSGSFWDDLKRGVIFVGDVRLDAMTFATVLAMIRSSQSVVVPVGSGTSDFTVAGLTDIFTNEGKKEIFADMDIVTPKKGTKLNAKDVVATYVQTANGASHWTYAGLIEPSSINSAGQAPAAATFERVTDSYTAEEDHAELLSDGLVATDLVVSYLVGRRGELKTVMDFDALLGVGGTLLVTALGGKGFGALYPLVIQPIIDKVGRGKNAALITQIQAALAKTASTT